MANKILNTEIVIVGAGLVGLTAAIAFAQQGRKVVLIDAKAPVQSKLLEWDARIYALTERTITWLKGLGIWAYVDSSRVNAIQSMQLWSQQSEQALTLDADDAHLSQMGCILENQNLLYACWQRLNALDVELITEVTCKSIDYAEHSIGVSLTDDNQIVAQLLLAADSSNSWVRQQAQIEVKFKAFNQVAVVANFEAEFNHGNIARQWFAAHETLALLPLPQNIVSMVWSLPTAQAEDVLALASDELAGQVEQRSHAALGHLKLLNHALGFSLNQQTAQKFVVDRLVFIGDAAHQVHPMAGQGVNLGFADVMKLSELTTKLHKLQDIGDISFLRKYERARKLEVLQMNGLTSGLDSLFAVERLPVPKLAAWGMQWLNQQAYIKKQLVKQATLSIK
jgi:2-polyprenylphenol 6-hydroxylase